MKSKTTKGNSGRSFRYFFIIFWAGFALSSCSQEVVFPMSSVVPDARASLEIEKEDLTLYEIEFEVKNLSLPGKLQPPRSFYVLWVETLSKGTINLGKLNFEKKNNAALEASIPYKPVRVFITAEDTPEAVLPSSQLILNSERLDL